MRPPHCTEGAANPSDRPVPAARPGPGGRPCRSLAVLLLGLVFVLSGFGGQGCTPPTRPVDEGPPGPPAATTALYLTPSPDAAVDGFVSDRPIWPHDTDPGLHEVAFFRRTFTLVEPLDAAELRIFADTRYEAWVDGSWVGRGPARFSRQTHEYDIHGLGSLGSGDHLIAVLVQWAPNTRRSESTTPFLRAHIEGETDAGGKAAFARTSSAWQSHVSEAWRLDSGPVHAGGLLGPTEFADLRLLPDGWMQPGFVGGAWAPAIEKEDEGATYRPRSIPLLANVVFTPTVLDAGALSPGRAIAELVSHLEALNTVAITVTEPTVLNIEVLAGSLVGGVELDGRALTLSEASASRPDVLVATVSVSKGVHSLAFSGPTPDGFTFSVGPVEAIATPLPFSQVTHAGRRLLLSEPVSQPELVATASKAEGLSIWFSHLPAYVVLDLGRTVHGRLVAKVTGPPEAVLDAGWDERLWEGSRPLPYPGSLHPEWNQTDSWVLDGGSRTISTIDARAGRYVLLAVWGEGSVRLENVRVVEERYPVVERGAFSSSNALLDKVWQVGVDTLYPNMVDAYADPWRERGQWWGDAYVDDHINRAAFGDTALLRRGLVFLAEAFPDEGRPPAFAPNWDGTHLLDYGMLWVQSLHDHWVLTEDTELPVGLYSTLRRFMAYLEGYEDVTTGLLYVPDGEWWQTALIDWRGRESRHGASTALNAMYYGTLLDGASIAEAVGDLAAAQVWRAKATLVRDRANKYLYRTTDRRYSTTVLDGQARPPSPHAQAWALAYGLVPDGEAQYVADALVELTSADPLAPNVEIYGMFWVLEALGRTGRIDEAIDLIERHYGHLLELGATTWWESFFAGRGLRYRGSLSHGWGGGPTWFLTTYVLGSVRTGSGTWQVRSSFNGVDHARGTLPLDSGELQVSWRRRSCGEAVLVIGAPAGSQGEAIIPALGPRLTLSLNDKVIWQDGEPRPGAAFEQPDGIHVPLGAGIHTLQVSYECEPADSR